MHLTKSNIILAVVAGLTLIAAVYYYFFYNKDTGSAVVATAPASAAELDFVNLTGQISTISFDTRIFSDPRFTRLVDIHTVVVPETAGRRDPFAPLTGTATTGK
ncbi:MAG: hypothetical protein JWM39_263 [Parcubacteria group bacterium]|nr:hypothetical protein [Parcubacteria group bacterium]